MSAENKRRAMKDGLDRRAVSRLSAAIVRAEPAFPASQFEPDSNEGLEQLELKARVAHVAANLEKHLPTDYRTALSIVLRAGESWPAGDFDDRLSEFSAWPLLDWVALAGLDDFDASLDALRRLTHLFTAELAIRPFILRDEQRALATLHRWTGDPDEHVRRLVSEGTRPRLPWAPRLPPFQRDPGPVLELLEKLKDDPSEYVRRSVANNLNDIAKDHPDTVAAVAERWMKDASKERRQLIRRATRTLVKQGHTGVLKTLGYTTSPKVAVELTLSPTRLQVGESLLIEARLRSEAKREQRLVVDYAIHHRKANGRLSPKTFKLRTIELGPGGEARLTKKHDFSPITVRRYYPGEHAVELLVAGQPLARRVFQLNPE